MMKRSPSSTSSGTKLILWMLLASFGLYALSSPGLSTLYVLLASDVLLASTLLPMTVDLLIRLIQTLLIPTAVWSLICFAYMNKEYSSAVRKLLGIYLASLLFCRVSDLAVTLGFQGSLSLSEDLLSALWYLLLDTVFALILFFIVRSRAKALRTRELLQMKADLLTSRDDTLPRTSIATDPAGFLYNKENPLLSCTLLLAVIYASVRVVQRILYDVFYSIELESLPTLSEIPVMIVYYLGDLLFGVCFYLLARLLYLFLYRMKRSQKA